MTLARIRLTPLPIVIALTLTGCFAATADSTDPSEPSAPPSVAATVAPAVTSTPGEAPSPTLRPTPPPTSEPSFDAGGGLSVLPNAEADALFVVRDTCLNRRDGYQVEFPEDWYTNTEIGRFAPCVWFSPTFYEVPSSVTVPSEIAVMIEWLPGDFGSVEELVTSEEVRVGTQIATRAEWAGAAGEGGDEPTDWRMYTYLIQLGPTPEEGPHLLVRTDTNMGGDYELNKAVMDRMMTTIEFVGTTQ